MKRAYHQVEEYIERAPRFAVSFEPVELDDGLAKKLGLGDDSPIHRMIRAAAQAGTGPMAAVAGTVAWAGAEAIVADGGEGMIDNGGDIVLFSSTETMVGWRVPSAPRESEGFAFRVPPTKKSAAPPGGFLGICSSSGKWGHSVSLGRADIATVFSPDPALADACATALANRINDEGDLETAFDFLKDIPVTMGAAASIDGKVAFWGDCPEIVRLAKQICKTGPVKQDL